MQRAKTQSAPTYEPNPYQERLSEIMAHSKKLNARPGDLVRLNKECIVPFYRERRKGEMYDFMIERYEMLTCCEEFTVLSCGNYGHYVVAEIIKRSYDTKPRPCGIKPCPYHAKHVETVFAKIRKAARKAFS